MISAQEIADAAETWPQGVIGAAARLGITPRLDWANRPSFDEADAARIFAEMTGAAEVSHAEYIARIRAEEDQLASARRTLTDVWRAVYNTALKTGRGAPYANSKATEAAREAAQLQDRNDRMRERAASKIKDSAK